MHHANLIIGSREWGIAQIPPEDKTPCADVTFLVSEHMSVEDARNLIYEAGLRPVTRPYRSFVIQTERILHEAQNTLLKLFEEPNAHTVFYLIIPREDMLLPTLRSRLQILGKEYREEKGTEFAAFLKMGYAERLAAIADRLKKEDIEWVRSIARGCSRHAHASRDAGLIRDVLMMESHIHNPGASKKMLLEHIALSLSAL